MIYQNTLSKYTAVIIININASKIITNKQWWQLLMSTSTTIITIETIIMTINKKTLESSKGIVMKLRLVNWIMYGIIIIKKKKNWNILEIIKRITVSQVISIK